MSVTRRAWIAQGKRGGGGAATLKFYICMSHKRATIFPSRCYQSARDVVAAGAEEIQRAVEKAGAWKPRHKLSLFLSLSIYIYFSFSLSTRFEERAMRKKSVMQPQLRVTFILVSIFPLPLSSSRS